MTDVPGQPSPSSTPPPSDVPQAPSTPQAPNVPPPYVPPTAAPPTAAPPAAVPPAGGVGTPGVPGAGRCGLPLGAILGIIGGALVLVLVVVIVAAIAIPRLIGSAGGGSGDAAASVTTYLKAVAAGDAEKALAQLDRRPASDTYLTHEMLVASEKTAPIRSISVTKPARSSSFDSHVTARYRIGSRAVSAGFDVIRQDGGWKVLGGTDDVDLGDEFSGLDLTLNGVAVKGDTVTLFPGAYALATASDDFTFGDDAVFQVTEPFDSPDLTSFAPKLTDAGLTAFRSAVTASANACLASTSLQAGCGIDVPATLSDGTQVVDGTLSRHLDAEAKTTLAGLNPDYDSSDPTRVPSEQIGTVDVDAQCIDTDGSRSDCSVIGAVLGSPVVDFSTSPPTVRWDE